MATSCRNKCSKCSCCSKLAANLKDLFLYKDHADVTFEFNDGEEVRAHKAILAARVPLFQKMLSSGMIESQTNRVKIEDADARCFADFLLFIYCGEIPVAIHGENLLILSVKYDVPDLVGHCVSKLKSEFRIKINSFSSPEDVESEAKQLLQLSQMYNIPAVKSACENELRDLLKDKINSLDLLEIEVSEW